MLSPDERRQLIDKYASGYSEVVDSLEGFKESELRERPLEGKWTANEIVHHLADSESISAHRLRRLLIEDKPLIVGYDQDQYARELRYNERAIAPALDAFKSARTTTLQLLEMMTDDDWKRVGEHTESGPYAAEDWLKIYAAHAHNHASQIRSLKEAMHKRMVDARGA